MYALITGGSRGIGAAIARRLAADGFDIVLNYRSRADAAQGVADAIVALGRQAELLPFDVADREAARQALGTLVEARGAPDAVVVNAGITRDGLFPFMSDEDWDTVLATGLGGFFNVVRPLVGGIARARRGRIVAIASTSGQMGNPGQVNYAAAKGGLIAACKSLARELARRGITVNVVAPGLVDTEMIKGLPLDQLLQIVPMQRVGTVDEVAAVVGFLCGAGASYVTGQVVGVNGGLYM